jgi:ferredoxin
MRSLYLVHSRIVSRCHVPSGSPSAQPAHLLEVDAETILLDAALAAGFNLPYGCRNGACGSCKGRIVSGTVDYGKYQAAKLTDAEKAQGYALFCCATARSDLVLECREVGGMKDIAGAHAALTRVQKLERVAPDVMRAQPQAARQRAPAIPRRPVHRHPAARRQAAQFFDRQCAA